MTSDYEQRKAAWANKALEQEKAERQKEIVVGETYGKVEKNIINAQELKVKINEVGDLILKPSVDFNKGDILKITIKSDPSLSEEHILSWGREKPSHPDEAFGTVKGKIKADHEIKIKIDHIDVQKIKSSAELDKGDSVRLIIEKT
jgi:hypothetical protein